MDMEMDHSTKQYVVYHRVLRLLSSVFTGLDLDTSSLPLWEDIQADETSDEEEEESLEKIQDCSSDEDSMDRKLKKPLPTTLKRTWEKCKMQVQWLEKQPISRQSDVQILLREYYTYEGMIDTEIATKIDEYNAVRILKPCQRRLARLQRIMTRPNRNQAHDAYNMLMNDVTKLVNGPYVQTPLVVDFLTTMDQLVSQYETTFQIELTEKEKEKRIKLATVRAIIENIVADSHCAAQALKTRNKRSRMKD